MKEKENITGENPMNGDDRLPVQPPPDIVPGEVMDFNIEPGDVIVVVIPEIDDDDSDEDIQPIQIVPLQAVHFLAAAPQQQQVLEDPADVEPEVDEPGNDEQPNDEVEDHGHLPEDVHLPGENGQAAGPGEDQQQMEVVDGNENGSEDAQPNGSEDAQPNGSEDAQPNGSEDAQPNGSEDAQPNGSEDAQPNGSEDAQPNGSEDAQPNGSEDAEPNGHELAEHQVLESAGEPVGMIDGQKSASAENGMNQEQNLSQADQEMNGRGFSSKEEQVQNGSAGLEEALERLEVQPVVRAPPISDVQDNLVDQATGERLDEAEEAPREEIVHQERNGDSGSDEASANQTEKVAAEAIKVQDNVVKEDNVEVPFIARQSLYDKRFFVWRIMDDRY